MIPFNLSDNLSHTWFIDLDGTVFEHNGYLTGEDTILSGVEELWDKIPCDDFIIIVTGRSLAYKDLTTTSLKKYNLRFNHIIFDLPLGERIVINDKKPSGLETAISWNVDRNKGFK
jgi:hypothetical protein